MARCKSDDPKWISFFQVFPCSWGSLLLKNPSKERHDVVQWYVLLNSCSFLKFFTIFRVNYHIPAYVDFFIYIAEYLNQQSATYRNCQKKPPKQQQKTHSLQVPFLTGPLWKAKEPLNTQVQKPYSFEAKMTHHHTLSVSSQSQKAQGSFAALRHDGTVVSWGIPRSGGDSSEVQDQYLVLQQQLGPTVSLPVFTFPETNSSPLKLVWDPKGNVIFKSLIFMGELLVSGRVPRKSDQFQKDSKDCFVFCFHSSCMFRCCMIAVGNIGPEWRMF